MKSSSLSEIIQQTSYTCRTAYPSRKSLKKDHPELLNDNNNIIITVQDKRTSEEIPQC